MWQKEIETMPREELKKLQSESSLSPSAGAAKDGIAIRQTRIKRAKVTNKVFFFIISSKIPQSAVFIPKRYHSLVVVNVGIRCYGRERLKGSAAVFVESSEKFNILEPGGMHEGPQKVDCQIHGMTDGAHNQQHQHTDHGGSGHGTDDVEHTGNHR